MFDTIIHHGFREPRFQRFHVFVSSHLMGFLDSVMGNAVTSQIVGSVVDDKIDALTGGDDKEEEEKPKKSTADKIKEAEEEKREREAREARAAERAAANKEKANAIRAKYNLPQKE